MADIEFTDNSVEVKNAIKEAAIAWLHEAGGELQTQVKRNTAVDTGQLKNSWNYKVDESKLEAVIGSPLENAIWEEFGTGEFALNGNGRKTPWSYQDAKGKWHKTKGKKPKRALFRAFTKLKPKIMASAKEKFGGLK